MMSEIPLEGLSSESGYNNETETAPVPPELPPPVSTIAPPSNSFPLPSGPSLTRRISSALCCSCGCDTSAQSTPLHQVQPVILRPTNDVYLELKPNRRLRVIHIPPGGTGSFSQKNNGELSACDSNSPDVDEDSSSGDDEYWFENADPKRPQIQTQALKTVSAGHQRRIFHKLAPQDRSAVPGSKIDKNIISPGRLPRKKFVLNKDEKDQQNKSADLQHHAPKRNVALTKSKEKASHDVDPGVAVMNSQAHPENPDEIIQAASGASEMPDLIMNLTDLTHHDDSDSSIDGGRKSPKKFDAESPDPTFVSVVTIPDPGESCTEDEIVEKPVSISGSVVVTGSYLGGVANIGFEAEEETDAGHEALNDSFDAGYKRNRNLSDVNISWKSDHEQDEIEPASEESNPESLDIKSNETRESQPKDQLETQGDKKPILYFIHGVGGSADSWQNQLTFFSALGYEVIAPDLLGHGFSSTPDRPKAYTFTKLFRDTLTIFDHFCVSGGRQNPCVVIGHSYGGSIATALARSRPEQIKVLILIASGGPTALSPPSILIPPPNRLMTCINPLFSKCGFVQRKKAKAKGKSTGIHDGFDVPAYVVTHTLMGQIWPEGDVAFHRRITIPTLLVYGLKDGFVSLVEMCEMERTLPKAYLELIPLAGHLVMQDQPKELNAMIKKFVEKYQPNSNTKS